MNKPLLILVMLLSLSCCAAKKPGGPIRSYEYSYNNCMAYPVVSYEVVQGASGAQTLNWSKNDGQIHAIALEEDVLGKIDGIVKKYRLYRLRDHYDPPFDILDGYSWHIGISYSTDGIYSGGSNAWPSRRHTEGISAINAYLESLIAAH